MLVASQQQQVSSRRSVFAWMACQPPPLWVMWELARVPVSVLPSSPRLVRARLQAMASSCLPERGGVGCG